MSVIPCACMHVCVVGVIITIINTEFYRIVGLVLYIPHHFHNLRGQYHPLSDESAAE